MDTVVVLAESLVIGALAGFGASAGAARMFHAPTVQGMGAFRTYGEMNACKGDPVAHFSFGLGFLFNAWASVVGAGALTQDVDHRIIPNWAAGALMIRNKSVADTMHNPKKMAIAGAIVGAVLVTLLNTTASVVPTSLQSVAVGVLVPASAWLLNPVMPILFWIAAMDAGKKTGIWGTVLGGLSHLILGNAVPGIVLHSAGQEPGTERLEPDQQDHVLRHHAAVRLQRLLPRLRHHCDEAGRHGRPAVADRSARLLRI